jgi:hypothetical protein
MRLSRFPTGNWAASPRSVAALLFSAGRQGGIEGKNSRPTAKMLMQLPRPLGGFRRAAGGPGCASGGDDPGGDARRPYDVRAHWRHAGAEQAR